jgi:D-alanyl-D-alanine carboxypeptidase
MRLRIERLLPKPSRITAFLTLLSLLVTATSQTRADPADDYVRAEMGKREIPGLSLAVIKDGRVIKEAAFGVSSVELGTPTTLDTVYVLASMTKVFTASAIMLLEQDGKISLDQPIVEILPTLPTKWSAVTIRHCLRPKSRATRAFGMPLRTNRLPTLS